MDNSVRNYRGDILGYECWTCGKVSQSMWGETCNECRNKEKQSNSLVEEVRKLREEISNLKNQ
jgi:hypothetical protein